MASEVHIIRVPPVSDGKRHDWTCPKAAPMLRTGGCNCGNVCQHPGCALYGAGGICGRHGVYDGVRCPVMPLSDQSASAVKCRLAVNPRNGEPFAFVRDDRHAESFRAAGWLVVEYVPTNAAFDDQGAKP
jgi:hypothetical protein